MAVYLLVELEITNMEAMEPYIKGVGGTIAAHGGKYVVRGGNTEVVEGGIGEYPLKVIIEFPSMALAKDWYQSGEYQEILPFRQKNSRGNLIWVDGV